MMACEVVYTPDFEAWLDGIPRSQQKSVAAVLSLLGEKGPLLPFPYSSGVNGSRHPHMRELRVQSGGTPLGVFYAFDPLRQAVVLVGGDKTGDRRFYEKMIPVADRLYDAYLATLREA
jgi:hypothetical protein